MRAREKREALEKMLRRGLSRTGPWKPEQRFGAKTKGYGKDNNPKKRGFHSRYCLMMICL